MNAFKIILIGNYPPDKQESMLRFARMLKLGFCGAGIESEIWWPTVLFGARAKSTNSGIGKWLGYLDKYMVFPLILRLRMLDRTLKGENVRFHVCDHSNAPYLKYLPADRASITCHDVIAIRGGMGYTDSCQPASRLGKVLQKWILFHLSRARLIASVSQYTLKQLRELVTVEETVQKDWRVIYNGFNADFKPMAFKEARTLLKEVNIVPDTSFILHVGSGHPRKNRKFLLEVVRVLDNYWTGSICFAGEAIDTELMIQAKLLGLQKRIISVVKPDHQTLIALYSTCEAFIFPSVSEGFGWPLIEAQACGAPVIASNIEPMPEVSGRAALHADPADAKAFADLFISLNDKSRRSEIVKRGFENSKRFQLPQIIDAYLNLLNFKGVMT